MSTLSAFRKGLAEAVANQGLSVHTWASGGRRSANLVEITTAPRATVLYVKEFNVPYKPGFWGLTKNQLERLEANAQRWLVVLLLRSDTSGYLLTSTQVAKLIVDGSFELSGDGDFKVNENLDLHPADSFSSLEEVINWILE